MNVNWRHIHAIPMPAALTQMAALTAHVGKALKATGSTAQVFNNYITLTTRYKKTSDVAN